MIACISASTSSGGFLVRVSSGAATATRIFSGPGSGPVAARRNPATRRVKRTPGMVASSRPSASRSSS